MNRLYILTMCCCIFTLNIQAFNLRKTASALKGSVVNSIYQNNHGIMWIGTNAGISRYDGKSTTLLTSFRGMNNIHGTRTDKMITGTLYGLKIYDETTDSITSFDIFDNVTFSTSDSKETVYIIRGDGSVYYKTVSHTNFQKVSVSNLISDKVELFDIDHNDILRITTSDGTFRSFDIIQNGDTVQLNEKSPIKINAGIKLCFNSDNRFYVLDGEYRLYGLNLIANTTSFIADLKQVLVNKGKVTAGAVFKNEFYLGTENGLYVVKGDNSVKNILKTGVTCLSKDKFQDLIWIGTSGDGLYTYSYDLYTISSNLLSDFAPSALSPITTIYLDPANTLWLGTNDKGILIIPDYSAENEIKNIHLLSDRNGLPDNAIHSIQQAKHGLWIGCQSGLVFYSDKNKTFSKMHGIAQKEIRAVYEHDSILWITSYEEGIVKANVVYNNDMPEIRNPRLYTVNEGYKAANRFSSITVKDDAVFFVNNGNGIFEFANKGLIKYAADKFNSINHMVAINKTDYMAAADFGTLRFGIQNQTVVGNTLLNHMGAKDIVQGYSDDYWLSTDNGLAIYNAELNTFHYFDNLFGLTVTEYTNGASFKDEQSGMLFFGGINGFTTINYNDHDAAMDYMPPLFLEQLALFGADEFVSKYENEKSDGLLFKSTENYFTITFNALDYINGNNYIYYYKIDDGQWINNGNSPTIPFTNVQAGDYELSIKYYNTVHEKESDIQQLSITVLPPWHRSIYAYGSYLLLILLVVFLVISYISKHRKRLRKEEAMRMRQQQKDEVYEAKLDFFVDIAHEFSTPLTLIHGPCNRILEQKNITPLIARYANLIDRNAKRMNSLIHDLMSFKQIESGHKQSEIKRLNVSEIADSVIDVFKIDASGTKIGIDKHYYAGINWNSDENFLITILTNLLSNAVKYSKGEHIKIEITIEDEKLKIEVSNEGKGIDPKDLDAIFDRYTVLNNSERREKWQQNGLGLAITSRIVKLLQGTIGVESIPDQVTRFTVCLPSMPESDDRVYRGESHSKLPVANVPMPARHYVYKEDWQTVTVVDDDPEMLWFICDILNDGYNVIPINDPTLVVDNISKRHTDIILCDMMMEKIDGIALAKKLKSNEETQHIPLIMVSGIYEIEKQTEAIDAGAEMYITKPFDSDYLKTTIRRLIGRKEDLKDYFASPLSAFEMSLGKLQHTEHRKYLKKIHSIINKNIENRSLSPNMIADELGISTRSLYRKLKEITDVGLLEMIHEGRLATADNLLMKSKLTIDQIVFKSGFSNRAGFYRAFSKKYGCTPTEFKERNRI